MGKQQTQKGKDDKRKAQTRKDLNSGKIAGGNMGRKEVIKKK